MSMTKKDFVMLAEEIKYAMKRLKGVKRQGALELVAVVLGACSRSNSNFKRDVFLKACELTEEELK